MDWLVCVSVAGPEQGRATTEILESFARYTEASAYVRGHNRGCARQAGFTRAYVIHREIFESQEGLR